MGRLDVLRERARGLVTNLGNPPPWPWKAKTIAENRARALVHGCCGHHGQPGC
jgi:hypothetical protein